MKQEKLLRLWRILYRFLIFYDSLVDKEHNPKSACVLSQQFYNILTKSNEKTEGIFDTIDFRD